MSQAVSLLQTIKAVAWSFIGIRNHETFPPSKAVGRLLTLLCALLVAGTMFTAVITA